MKPKKPNGFKKSEGNFEKPKKPDNDNEDDNEDEEDNDNNNNVVVGDSCVDGLQEVIDFYNAKKVGISDTQLYKQAGNSIVVNVLQAIFISLFKVLIK